MAEATDDRGELIYGESHILCNLFNIDAIERMGNKPLPYHTAFKKATYIDKDGNKVVPDGSITIVEDYAVMTTPEGYTILITTEIDIRGDNFNEQEKNNIIITCISNMCNIYWMWKEG